MSNKKLAEKLVEGESNFSLRSFSREDWYAWGGATMPKYSQPQIGEIEVSGLGDEWLPTGTVIVDKEGVSVNFYTKGGGCGAMTKGMSFYSGVKFAEKNLKPNMSYEELRKLGFSGL